MDFTRPALAFVAVLVCCQQLHAQELVSGERPSALPRLKLEQLAATRDRPLFTPGRRRAAPPPPPSLPQVLAPVDEEAKAPEIELTGLIEDNDVTIVFLSASSETVIVRSGDKFGRWRVVADSKTSVKLTDGAEELKLEMFAAH